MELENAIAAAAAGWLAMAMGWRVRSVQYGRRLVEQFEAYRRTQIRGLVVVLSALAAVGAAVVWLEHIA